MIRTLFMIAAIGSFFVANASAAACPFCLALKASLAEEIESTDVSVICKLTHRPDADAATVAPECTFEVLEVMKGKEVLATAPGATTPLQIKILYFGDE